MTQLFLTCAYSDHFFDKIQDLTSKFQATFDANGIINDGISSGLKVDVPNANVEAFTEESTSLGFHVTTREI